MTTSRNQSILPLIFIGGAAGTLLRYFLGKIHTSSTSLPLGILIANLLGALILGGVISYLEHVEPKNPARIRALLGTGFCGGLTTFSTLCAGTVGLIQNHEIVLGVCYVAISGVFGLAAFYVATILIKTSATKQRGQKL